MNLRGGLCNKYCLRISLFHWAYYDESGLREQSRRATSVSISYTITEMTIYTREKYEFA